MPSPECYVTADYPAAFSRLETARERIALPYSLLLAVSLSMDESVLGLDFASHKVTVTGKRLYEIYCAISAARGQVLQARGALGEIALGPTSKTPFIREIRIYSLETQNNKNHI